MKDEHVKDAAQSAFMFIFDFDPQNNSNGLFIFRGVSRRFCPFKL